MTNYSLKRASKLYLLFITLPLSLATLRVGFYTTSCPLAESTIRRIVQQRFVADKSVTPALLRMHYHDCFVRGCDASILIDSTRSNQTEKGAGANLGVRGYEVIDQIKARLESICPETVSCADIIALATREALRLAGGPNYDVPTGRRDGRISRSDEVNLPGPSSTVSEAQKVFRAHGLTLDEMVVLLGAHTVGTAHCSFFRDRLSNFRGSGAPDPTMERGMVDKLKNTCGSKIVDRTVFLDENTSFLVDNMYYKQIIRKRGVLKIDQEIEEDMASSKFVAKLAADNALFGEHFAKAMVKLGSSRVLEGRDGEIRRNCRVINH
ncbi:peroxidase 57 [Beta vulgaris subsp. vulgaris]|uniref:peroxidase 57 n=1 Tax=Beta vulgaris subsp. vulgaris TaxID=3555 RepID=UPI00053FEC5C|nr:peroxidase 57 [Beta vulgaris subsp. vulgaris]